MRNIIRWVRLKWLKLMRLKDDPSNIAKGFAIGIAMDFLPTFGFGLIFAYVLAFIFRVNRVAAVLSAIFFKWAIPVFYFANIVIGKLLAAKELKAPRNMEIIETKQSFFYFGSLSDLSTTFLIGSLINSIVAGIIAYYLCLSFIRCRRKTKTKNSIKQ